MSSDFDRLRPRSPQAVPSPATRTDPEGKRALFSATLPGSDRPTAGTVVIECSGCGGRSVVSPVQAMQAAFPSVVFGLRFAHGDSAWQFGSGRDYPAWVRCPSCGRRRWTRLSINI